MDIHSKEVNIGLCSPEEDYSIVVTNPKKAMKKGTKLAS
jgi:hypothetical protein